MKYLLIIILLLQTSFSFAQNTIAPNAVDKPVYDTTSLDIKSTNSFYFCSTLYKIPRDCENNDQSSCCSFSAQVHKGEKVLSNGQLGCYNGTSLFWTYFETEEAAKQNFESMPGQLKKQMKTFSEQKIKLLLCNKEVEANKLNYTTLQGYQFSQIIFYGTINNQSVYGQLHIQKELKSSNELNSLFQQIVKF